MINIFGKLLLRGIYLELNKLSRMLRAEFAKIEYEFEEHLQAINENTNEIAANYEYISEIEKKMERLSERLDQLQMSIEFASGISTSRSNSFNVKRLERREQEVFLVVYTLEEEKGSVTYADIADKLKISEQLAGNYITSLIEKGVPIIKKYVNSKPYIRLDPDFKTLQTKENILQLSLEEFGF